MPVHFIHAPYMKESRDKLIELQQLGANIIYTERWKPDDDLRYDFSKEEHNANYISFLPSVVLLDDDEKTVLCRAEHIENITKENVDWMHRTHAQWKKDKTKPFPHPPWKKVL